ncbi:MAG: hypothetical protein WBC91_09120 [Phototrophicaceae bacterium]
MLIQELSTIISGMTICDVNGDRIGIVDKFILNKEAVATDESEQQTVEDQLKQLIGEHSISENLNEDVYKIGFLHIECGLFEDNIIVFPHQIDAIDGKEIYLNINKDDLLSF